MILQSDSKNIFTDIDSCRLCSSKKLHSIVDLTNQPPANSLRKDLGEVLPKAPLKLIHCESCAAVQLTSTVDPNYLFSHYVWVTGTSSTARDYSDFYCKEVLRRVENKSPFVVEVASNDGTFLRKFKDKGCKVLGVDPAKNIASKASESGIPTLADFFNSQIANQISQKDGPADVVMARNVIPHVKEIHSITKGLSSLVKKDGIVVIEFHYAESILKECHYDSIYHEHLFYFSLKSLSSLFQQYGLYPYDAFLSPISGGSVVLFFSQQQKEPTTFLKDLLKKEELSGLNQLSSWKKFGEESIQHASDLKKIVSTYAKDGKLIGYGASARSSTMLNFAALSNQEIECIIDRNPLKQNLYTPGTNIKIISYEEGLPRLKGKHLLLLAWNFEEEVVRDLRADGFTGDILVPLPNKVRIRKVGDK